MDEQQPQSCRSCMSPIHPAAKICPACLSPQKKSAFASVRDELLGYRHNAKGSRAVETVRAKLEKDRRELQPFLDVFRPGVATTLRDVMVAGQERGLTYNVITLSAEQAVISGTAPDWDRPQALQELLTSRGYAVRVERQSATDDERIPFTVVERGSP